MGMLDMFLPGGFNLTPDQQSSASNAGLMNASLALINASGNHYGLRPSTLQVLGQGVQGYGQGVGNYANTMADQQQNLAKGQMSQLQAQRALSYFYPNAKGDGMAAALASPQSPQSGLSSFYGPSSPSQPIPPVTGSPVGAGYGQPSGGQFPPTAGGSPVTAFGTDIPSTARALYKQGMDMMMLGQQGGDGLIKQAIDMDPTIIASSEAAKTGADYPFELGKIAATGQQSRQTEGYKAGVDPYTETVMVNGQPTMINTNKMAAATGSPMPQQKPRVPPPPLSAFYGNDIPRGAGAANVPVGEIPQVPASALRPPEISTAVPLNAKNAAETSGAEGGKNLAENQKTLTIMTSNLPQALDRFNEMSKYAKDASSGLMAATHIGPAIANTMNNPTSVANAKIEQLSAQGILPELGPQLAQAGIRGNKFLETLSSNASGLDLTDSPAAKQEVINGLREQYIKNLVSTNNSVAKMGGQPVDLASLGVFLSPKDPGFDKLPSGATFYDAKTGKQMVKH